MGRLETQVGIVGAGPAGLMLSHLLHLNGIGSIVLEARSRAYCEERIRAGVLEHTSVQMLRESGVGERLDREGLRHEGIDLGSEWRAASNPLRRAHGQARDRLWPAGSREGSDRPPFGRWRGCALRMRRSVPSQY